MFRANFQRTGVYKTKDVRHLRGVKWKFQQSPDLPHPIPGYNYSLAVENEVLCVESSGGNVYGLSTQTGQQLWNLQLGKETKIFSLSIADTVLYISTRKSNNPVKDDCLWAINVQSGQQLWKFKLPFQLSSISLAYVFSFSSPVVANDVVYIGGNDGNLYAIDKSSGELIWSFKTTKNMTLTSPAIRDDILCVCSSEGFLQALDLETGEQLWRFETSLSDRWVLNPHMWFYGFVNQLMKIFTGNTYNLEKFSEPVVVDGVIYVSCSNGYAYALH